MTAVKEHECRPIERSAHSTSGRMLGKNIDKSRGKGEAMTDKKDKSTLARRDLFRAAGLGVGALGAVAVGVAAGAEPADAATPQATSQGYRETDHVRTVYELSRF